MTSNEMERYSNMPLEELEVAINDLNKERMDIAEAIQNGDMKEDYGKRKYSRVDKKHGELSIMFEKRLAGQYNAFVGCFAK